jgi:hypothetical protein
MQFFFGGRSSSPMRIWVIKKRHARRMGLGGGGGQTDGQPWPSTDLVLKNPPFPPGVPRSRGPKTEPTRAFFGGRSSSPMRFWARVLKKTRPAPLGLGGGGYARPRRRASHGQGRT